MAINFGRGQGDMFAMLMKALQANKVEPNKPRDRNIFNVKRAIQGDSFLPTKEAVPVEETVEEPTADIAKTFLSGFMPKAPTTMPPGQEAANLMNNRNQALIDLLPSKEQIGTGIETAKDMAGTGMDMLKQGTSDYLDYASNQKSGGTILDTLRGFGRDVGDFVYDKLGTGNVMEQGMDNEGALMNDLIEAGGDPLEVLSLVKGVDPSRNIMNDVPVDEFGLEFGGDYSDEDILDAVNNFNLSRGESIMPPDAPPGSSLDIGAESDVMMGSGGSPLLDAIDMANLPTYGQDFSGESFEEFGPPYPTLEEQRQKEEYDNFDMLEALRPENQITLKDAIDKVGNVNFAKAIAQMENSAKNPWMDSGDWNNPGNLRNPRTGEFRKFNTMDEGRKALLDQLNLYTSGESKSGIGPDSSLFDFVNRYAADSPMEEKQAYFKLLLDTVRKGI